MAGNGQGRALSRGRRGPHGGLGFAEYLKELPPARVLERFVLAGQRERRILSAAEIDRICSAFAAGGPLRDTFAELSPEAQVACSLSYLTLPAGLPSAACSSAGQELLDSFLVHVVRDRDGNLMFRGFYEFEPALRAPMVAVLREAAVVAFDAEPQWRQAVHVVNDLTLTVMLASSGVLQTTRAGTLSKASQVAARKLLHCGKSPWKREIHRPIRVLVDVAQRMGFLVRREGGYRLDRQRFNDWLNLGADTMYGELVREVTTRERPWHWPLAVSVCALKMTEEGREWVRLDAMGGDVTASLEAGAQTGEALGMLCAQVVDGQLLCAARPDALARRGAAAVVPPREAVTVLPDFSVIIHQECAPTVLRDFCELGELFSLDGVYRGTISRQAIGDSLYDGAGAERIMERLSQWQAPHIVVETVREWVRVFGRVCVPDEGVVLVGDAGVGEQLGALESARGLIEPVAAARAFRIKPGHVEEVRQMLAGLGFDTRAPRVWVEPPGTVSAVDQLEQERDEQCELVTDTASEAVAVPRRTPGTGGKYGAELKELPQSEMDHVIDYAMLMGHRLRLEYEGSPSLKRGEYTVLPAAFSSGAEGVVEGEDVRTGTRKRFLRERIKAIGVLES